jgi:hypothetical protein
LAVSSRSWRSTSARTSSRSTAERSRSRLAQGSLPALEIRDAHLLEHPPRVLPALREELDALDVDGARRVGERELEPGPVTRREQRLEPVRFALAGGAGRGIAAIREGGGVGAGVVAVVRRRWQTGQRFGVEEAFEALVEAGLVVGRFREHL